jgi:large subunit ribosomal protein L35e
MSQHLKVKDVRSKGKEELLKQLTDVKKELSQLRVAKQTNANASKVGKIKTLRKNVARILTVLNQNERLNTKKALVAAKAALPKTLKAKLTHRRRLALTQAEKNIKTRRAARVAAKFPKRVFAVKL